MLKKVFIFLVALFSFMSFNVYAKSDKNTLIVAQNAEAKSLDPMASNDVPSHRIILNIYDTLVFRDADGKLSPGLAESWTQIDPLTLEMTLRKGVKFHNGEELKSSDAAFTLLRAKESPSLMTYFGEIDRVDIVDDYTFRIVTKKPFGPLLMYLSHQGVGVMNEKAVKEAGDNYAQHPIGTGPYEFVSWRSGDRVVLKANPDYYKGKAKTENLIFRVISEGANRTIALETGEVDIAYDIDPIDMELVRNHSNLKLLQAPASSITYLGFNYQKPPFDKKEVRQAIAYAIDMNSIINAVYLGAATEANSPVPPATFGYNKDIKPYTYNIAKAKELLAKAGFPNGFKTKIWLNDKTDRKDISVIVQDQLKQIGIDVEIEIIEWGAYLDRLARGEQEMFILGWSSNPDSDAAMYALYHSKNKGAAGNRAFYGNSEVDKLLDAARENTNQEEREKLYQKVQEIVQEELPLYILVYPDNTAGIQKNIKGFVLDSQSEHILYNVTK